MRARRERAEAHVRLLAMRNGRWKCQDCKINKAEFLEEAIKFTEPRKWWRFW